MTFPSPTPRAWTAGLAAAVASALIYGLLSFLHARAFGAMAIQGPDLWFYTLVARGWESLSPFDLTRWLVAPAAGMSPPEAKIFLSVLAAVCNAAAAFLVAWRLEDFILASGRTGFGFGIRFAAGLLFALLPHNVALSVASFTHFTIAQLVLLAALQQLLPWLDGRRSSPPLAGLLLLAEAMVIGPEGFAVAAWVVLLAAWRWRAWRPCLTNSSPSDSARAAPPTGKNGYALLWEARLAPMGRSAHRSKIATGFALGLLLATLLLYEPAFHAWSRIVLATRGIDLLWQRNLYSGDLLPLGFSLATLFWGINLLWLTLALWHLRRGDRPLAWLVLWLAALSLNVFRPAFLLQLAGFLLLLRTLTVARHPVRWLGGGLVVLGILAFAGFSTPVFPGDFARVASEAGRPMSAGSRIACSPTYGFYLEAWTGRHATATMHRRNPLWQELAASSPASCARRMREAGIGALWITTHDFRLTPEGYWSSSGLQETLQPLGDTAFQDSVAVRLALGRDLRPLRIIVRAGTGPERVWCLTAE